jgi:DNA processing protein
MEEKDRVIEWLCLQKVAGVGPILAKRLMDSFNSPEAVFAASTNELSSVTGVSRGLAESIKGSKTRDEAEREWQSCKEQGIRVLTLDHRDYPQNLRQIPDPPIVLYCKGRLVPEDNAAVAVVGTREPTEYGRAMASRIGSGLARAGVTLVSGMARGVDSIAQEAALAAGGRSIAVLGSGVDVVYPREKKALYKELAEKGAVLSEFPLGAGPSKENFPRRNRIISGLSLGLVVIQARSEKSGSLITARMALDQNRQVYAVPGAAGHPDSKATNSLIRQGAQLVESAEDIIEDIRPQAPFLKVPEKDQGSLFEAKSESLREGERDIFFLVPGQDESPIHIDELIKRSNVSPGEASGILLNLELQGLIRQIPGKRFIKIGY